MPGYWWLRHRLSILIGGFVLASLVRLEGKKLRGIPLLHLALASTPGVLVELGWFPARCKWARIYT